MTRPRPLGALTGRVAAAPVSWGVNEAPGWGASLPPEVVLPAMARLGLPATELGPTGYLGATPGDVERRLAAYGMRLVGGFLPVVLHEPELDLASAEAAMRVLAEAGSDVVVLAADSGPEGYDQQLVLDDEQWERLAGHLATVRDAASALGLRTTLHPHVGTAIESDVAVRRLLEVSDVALCLDTGHLTVGGADPVAIAREVPERIGHVHLKDVRAKLAAEVAARTVSFTQGVRDGLFAPLGDGDVDIAAIVSSLEANGYSGWYVLEQDAWLADPSPDVPNRDAARSVEALARIAATLVDPAVPPGAAS